MSRPIKSKGDGHAIAFPKLWPGHGEEPKQGTCPFPGCPCKPRGTGELCDDDHCRELRYANDVQ